MCIFQYILYKNIYGNPDMCLKAFVNCKNRYTETDE